VSDSDLKNTSDAGAPNKKGFDKAAGEQRTDPAPDDATGAADNNDNGLPSAIERQRAAVEAAAALGLSHHDTPRPPRSPLLKYALSIVLVLWLLALSVGYVFNDFRAAVMATVNRAERVLVEFTQPEEITPAPQKPIAAPTAKPPNNIKPDAAATTATVAATTPAVSDSANALTIPINDVSLRVRPELLQQLVAVYRLRLAHDPNDAAAKAALTQLRERSFAELGVISTTESASVAATSFEITSRLFPELASEDRYQILFARANLRRQLAEAKSTVPAEPTVPVASPTDQSAAPITPEPAATVQEKSAQLAAKTTDPSPAPAASPPAEAAKAEPAHVAKPVATSKVATSKTVAATKTDAAPAPTKPDVRVISLTPGKMAEGRFVPAEGGNVFMLEINYRDIGSDVDTLSGSELVVRLGSGRDPQVLAEASVDIAGGRGTKSFLMGTLVPGYSGEVYKLNFILDGRVLPSRTARLSLAGNADARR
jgi:hypothetical protein